jgi:predicted DNA-binding protein YlxM (UPF0122 family)
MSSIAVQLPMPRKTIETLKPVVEQKAPQIGQLSHKAMTIQLCISMWTNRKYDKTVSKEVEENKEAEKDAGRYNKVLVSKEALKEVQSCVSSLRSFHYFNTYPWSDNGERLLPSANYFTYVNQLNELRKNYEQAVAEFLDHYDRYVDEARVRLGQMFNISDYPTKDQLKEKFAVKPVFMPVPDSDFRVGLNAAEAQKLKEAAEKEMTERLTTAMKDAWKRIKEQLSNMKEKLSNKETKFRDSLFENLAALVDVLPRLNVTNDLNLHRIVEEMQNLLADPDTVRSDDTIRSIKAQQVENLMERYKDFF